MPWFFYTWRCRSFPMHGLPLSFNIILEYPGFITSDDVFHQFRFFIKPHKKTWADLLMDELFVTGQIFGTNLAQTFFMLNSPRIIFLIVFLLVLTVSAIIQLLIRQSPCTVSLILIIVCEVDIETGQPGHWLPSMLSLPSENYLYHSKTHKRQVILTRSIFQQLTALSRTTGVF